MQKPLEAASDSQSQNADPVKAMHSAPANLSRELECSWWSRLFFSWVNPLLSFGYKQPLQLEHLDSVRFDDSAGGCHDKFHHYLQIERAAGANGKLWRAVWATNASHMLLAGLLILCGDLLGFVPPLALKYIVMYVQTDERSGAIGGVSFEFLGSWYGYILAGVIFVSAVLQSLFLHHHHMIVIREGIRLRTTVISAIFAKTLRLPSYAKNALGTGKITTLMSSDSQRLLDVFYWFHYIWTCPLQIVICLTLLLQILGLSALVGVGLMIILIPLQSTLTSRQAALTRSTVKATEARVGVASQLLSLIRAVKLYAWESAFVSRAERARQKEMTAVTSTANMRALNQMILDASPIIIAFSTFFVYTMFETTDGRLRAADAFTALALFQILRFPLSTLPKVLRMYMDG